MANLALGFNKAGLEPRVSQELDEITATIQAWANKGTTEQRGPATINQPRCKLLLPAAQTIATATETLVTWAEIKGSNSAQISLGAPPIAFDNGDEFGAGQKFLMANGTLITPPQVPGVYLVTVNLVWDGSSATGIRVGFAQWRYPSSANGREVICTMSHTPAATSGLEAYSMSGWYYHQARESNGEWPGIEVRVQQTSGGNLNLLLSQSNFIQMLKVA